MEESRPPTGAEGTGGTGSTDGADGADGTGEAGSGVAAAEHAGCVECGEPTEYPATAKGATLCPLCAWQEAERRACSG